MRLQKIGLIAAMSGLVGGVIAVAAVQLTDTGGSSNSTAAVVATASPAADSRQQASLSSGDSLSAADIYDKVRPSVVEVTSTLGSSGPFGSQAEGTGTGVVIDTDGHILTNNHVVDGARSVEVRFDDGSTASATIAGTDPANDIAILKIDPSAHQLTAATLGDSSKLRVGDQVLAIGNPFNLEGTLTEGIVSGLDRTYSEGASTRPIRGMIQTDAAVNPGNSGGPLLNAQGEVVGINTLLENPTGQNVNVGVAFAVAVNTAKAEISSLENGQTVSHPWLGIAGVDLTPSVAKETGISADKGVYVTLVSANSPASSAGLRGAFASQNQAQSADTLRSGGDAILAADGQQVTGIDQLATYLDQHKKPGDSVELTVLRDGNQMTITAKLAEWPS